MVHSDDDVPGRRAFTVPPKLRRCAKTLRLSVRLLAAMGRHAHDFPLTVRTLQTVGRQLLSHFWANGFGPSFLLTPSQIDRFLAGGWEYAETQLQLIQQISDFPLDREGAAMISGLLHRENSVRNSSFEEILSSIYRDPLYPVRQHISQAFFNQITGRQPFILDALSQTAPGPFLLCEVGCGTCVTLSDALEQHAQAYGYGVDISDEVIAYAQRVLQARGLRRRASVAVGDLRQLPFEDNTFDVVVAMEVLEHLPTPSSGMRELVRVLAPEGLLITSVPVQCPLPAHLSLFVTPQQVVALHRRAGLKVCREQIHELALGIPNVMISAKKEHAHQRASP